MLHKILNSLNFGGFSKSVSMSLAARFSHEFRTHLTGIIGYSEYLENSDNEGISKFTAKIIHESGLNLLKTGNAYFELNNFLNGDVGFDFSQFVLADLVEEAVHKHQPVAIERQIDLAFTCSEDMLDRLFTMDKARTSQMLDLLIFETIGILDQSSALSVILKADEKSRYILLNINFKNIKFDSREIMLYQDFWNDLDYIFKLQEGPGVVLAMVRQILSRMGSSFKFESSKPTNRACLTIALPII